MRWWFALSVVSLGCSLALGAGAAQDARAQLQQAYPGVQFHWQDTRLTRIYGLPFGHGFSAEQSAADFVQNHSSVFGLTPKELVPGNGFNGQYTQPVMYDPQSGAYKFTLVYCWQYRDGLPVFDAGLRLLVHNVDGYPLVLAASSLRDLGDFTVPAGAAANIAEGAAHAAARAEHPDLLNFSPYSVVVWPGEEQTAPAVALTFEADNGLQFTADYGKWLFVADAASGRILHWQNLIVHGVVNGSVHGMATTIPKADVCSPEVDTALRYAKVTVGSNTAYTDPNGNFTISFSGTLPVTVHSPMSGYRFIVNDQGGPLDNLSLVVSQPGPANFMHNSANTSEFIRAQVNAYVQANVVRDFALVQNPSYPSVSTGTFFPLNVNINDVCNAYYDGGSLNFFRAGSGCANTAFSSVVHHEYGHHLVNRGGSGQGAYGEGMSDCVAMLIADDPILGYGFQGPCSSGLRNANNNFHYPCVGPIHDCGQLLSGCVWSTRSELYYTHPSDYLAIISNLTINSILLHDGTEITPQITIDFLTLDDNDGDLYNGTPHAPEICSGFGVHSMPCPEMQWLVFSYPDGRPVLVSPAHETRFRVVVSAAAGEPYPGNATFCYQIDGDTWVCTAMTLVAPNTYEAVFPAVPCGTNVDYFVSTFTSTGLQVNDPPDAPTTVFNATGGYGIPVFDDDFETDHGWTVGDTGDNATAGLWDRDVPQATAAQPGADHTPAPGTMCWVTDHRAGSSVGEFSVHNGKTTLKSPVLDLSAYSAATISYWRWYSNDQGTTPNAEVFRVDISNNGGATWTNVETVGPAGPETAGGWFNHAFNVSGILPLTNQVRLRFVASANNAGSIVEAAVDDCRVDRVSCTPPPLKGDMNCDDVVNFADINPFVLALSGQAAYQAQYPSCDWLKADCNNDGMVNFADINPFVALLSQ